MSNQAKFVEAVEEVLSEYQDDSVSYHAYLIAFRLHRALEPKKLGDDFTESKRFHTLQKAIYDTLIDMPV